MYEEITVPLKTAVREVPCPTCGARAWEPCREWGKNGNAVQRHSNHRQRGHSYLRKYGDNARVIVITRSK
jgi:hypothetical protein